MISSWQRLVGPLEFVPLTRICHMMPQQVILVLVAHLKLVLLLVPQEHLFDLGAAWVAIQRIFTLQDCLNVRNHLLVLLLGCLSLHLFVIIAE